MNKLEDLNKELINICTFGDLEIVELLLGKGADINADDGGALRWLWRN